VDEGIYPQLKRVIPNLCTHFRTRAIVLSKVPFHFWPSGSHAGVGVVLMLVLVALLALVLLLVLVLVLVRY
jgi:hypothetical protein